MKVLPQTRKYHFVIALLAILSFALFLLPQGIAHAASLQESQAVQTWSTGSAKADAISATIVDSSATAEASKIVRVKFTHKERISSASLRLYKKGNSSALSQSPACTENTGAKETCNLELDISNYANGDYLVRLIVCHPNASESWMQYYAYLPAIKLSIKSGVPSLHSFPTAISHNKSVKATRKSSTYLNPDLSDLAFQFFTQTDKGKSSIRVIKGTEASLYKKAAAAATKNLPSTATKYQKLVAIFEYVGKHFYYDNYGLANGRKGFDDPYYNLKHVLSKTGSGYNYATGKVAVQCDGYAAAFIAMARAIGVPAYPLYGHKDKTPGATDYFWNGVSTTEVNRQNHTWVRAYVNGKWITIDPQQGSLNKRGESKTSKGDSSWKKQSRINYLYFDMSDQMLANSYYGLRVRSENLTKFKYFLKKGNSVSLSPYNLSAQKQLKKLGYSKSLSGKFTTSMKKAVKAFQKKNGLNVTGCIDKTTWKKLFSSKAKKK